MCESRKVAITTSPKIESVQKSAPEKYFNLITTILILTGMYPMSPKRSFAVRFLYSAYFWCVYIFLVVLHPVSKAMALPHQTNLDDFAENLGLVISYTMAAFKIAVFMIKRKDLLRLVETMEGQIFRHQDCSHKFSANRLICGTVRTSQRVHCFFLVLLVGATSMNTFKAIMKRFEEVSGPNDTESGKPTSQPHRALPYRDWYPFSTQISPNYELAFVYQMVALFVVGHMVFALDALIFSFMIHIKVQLKILSHNLRFIKSHMENWRMINVSASTAAVSQRISDETENQLTEFIELELGRNIAHHQAIIQLSQDLESVFTYQLLVQFICSLLALCLQMWLVSSSPVLTPSFASVLPLLIGVIAQIFTYCWLGNEIMLESSLVAQAAWDSGWCEISSRRYRYGVLMIIQRSQNVIAITAGGFAGLTLETFMTISRAAYSCFAVLKKMDG